MNVSGAFDNTIGIIVVIPENQFVLWENLREKHSFSVSHTLVKGGSSRFFSVKNGLQEVEDNAIVAIHDGVRPSGKHKYNNKMFQGGRGIRKCNPGYQSVRLGKNDHRKGEHPG